MLFCVDCWGLVREREGERERGREGEREGGRQREREREVVAKPVQYGTRLGDLKESLFILFSN